MKTLPILLISGLIAVAGPRHAGEAHQHDSPPPGAETKGKPQAAKPGATGGGMPMMANMKAMQAQMARIRSTTDPKEREKLMQEHMKSMQDNMAKMRGMGGGMMGGMASKGGDETKHHAMMEQRMDMMQMMMEQMLEHQKAMHAPPK